jgi:alkylation response protein AidB-like acyl-CoA dehydrogenase
MISGEYTGTMCLTEPGCGSDLGQVITKAERNGDGKKLTKIRREGGEGVDIYPLVCILSQFFSGHTEAYVSNDF